MKKYIFFIDDLSKYLVEEFESDNEPVLEQALSFGRRLYDLYKKPVTFYQLKDENAVIITKS